jgi:hypothetical protein
MPITVKYMKLLWKLHTWLHNIDTVLLNITLDVPSQYHQKSSGIKCVESEQNSGGRFL